MDLRVTSVNERPRRARGAYVLYWMTAARRARWSFALDHAVGLARELERPLVVLEALRAGYPWASDRFHAFVMEGMEDNARAFAEAGVTYLRYVEPEAGAGRGLVEALAKRAAVVVTDELPGFFLPRMVAALAARVEVRVDAVDGSGLLPLRAMTRAYPSAVTYRRQLQKIGVPHLLQAPSEAPLAARFPRDADVPAAIVRRCKPVALETIPIDHAVAPVPYAGGTRAAAALLDRFVDEALPRYLDRSDPDARASSELSPYLHFGHISPHEIAARVWAAEDWDPSRLAVARATGLRDGWWGLSAPAEGFLDELVVWRELGHNFCFHRADFDRWSALPAWARATLEAHAKDPRPERYTLATMEQARTGDPVWNAAQRQLLAEGRIHNYLRMVWGKRVLEWSPTPKQALSTLLHLNNKYAVDGRDASSWNGILWTFGLFDRPWGPERSIFGTVRYMSSARTVQKLAMKEYLKRWG